MNPGTVVAVSAAALLAIAILIAQIRWKSKRKKWCVVFYMVGRLPRTLIEWPEDKDSGELDTKLDQVIEQIGSLPCSSYFGVKADPKWEDDVHVVFRALWNDNDTDPLAKVVSWRPFAPKATIFPGEDLDPATKDLTNDLTHFFQWVYGKCPADHYAVFFWGHSMGPGGLFEVREEPYVPSPSDPLPPPFTSASIDLTEFERAFATLNDMRVADAPSSPPVLPYSRLTGANVQELGEEVDDLSDDGTAGVGGGGPLPTKVEIALFQDCWMSTLETAFQIQKTVRYVVASQSLVPIGYAPGGGLGAVWPYKNLIDCLLTRPSFSTGMTEILQQFFDGTLPPVPTPASYNRHPNPTLPFSLLDLGKQTDHVSTVLGQQLRDLVTALAFLDKPKRKELIFGPAPEIVGRLHKLDGSGDLEAGEVALLDVITLCEYLTHSSLWPSSVFGALSPSTRTVINNAAADVLDALTTSKLVKTHFESADALQALGFKGISVLWKPTVAPAGDPYLAKQVPGDHYEDLKFALETTISATGPVKSWKTYAFELPS